VTGLLVSVRSVVEAADALAGGCHLVDVKEPLRGSLGAADPETIRAVQSEVAGRRPVSAALGELRDNGSMISLPGLAYVKWGLSQCGRDEIWPSRLEDAGRQLAATIPGCRPVAVAYADWQRADAPPPSDVCGFAVQRRWPAFLIDTYVKDGTTLLDWLSVSAVASLCERCREAGVESALAGRLGPDEIGQLLFAAPSWFAVRGAACRSGQRDAEIDAGAVRRLVELIASAGDHAG
jgi:uncharacterized protein (UPF0264 family)